MMNRQRYPRKTNRCIKLFMKEEDIDDLESDVFSTFIEDWKIDKTQLKLKFSFSNSVLIYFLTTYGSNKKQNQQGNLKRTHFSLSGLTSF